MSATGRGTFARMHPWWDARTSRERWMLGAMAAMLAAFAYWYGLHLPLRGAAEAARLRHDRAAAELARVRSEAAGIAALEERMPARPGDAAALRAAVLAAAAKAGLAVSRERDDGGFGIEADAASPGQLFAFLDALRQDHGLAPATLSAAKSEGRLRVQAQFVTAAH